MSAATPQQTYIEYLPPRSCVEPDGYFVSLPGASNVDAGEDLFL